MTDSGTARIVMGNHEFNALCYATEHDGDYLRPHSPKNDKQHAAFQALGQADRWRFLDWFKSFPLWIDLGGLRVVHACWRKESIEAARTALAGNRFDSWTAHTACVDFSAVKGGTLVAYRWSGEAEISRRNYYPYGR